MKKNYLFFVMCIGITLFSCSDELSLPNEPANISTRAGGDGVYDILGYGYDCTQSDFIGTSHARLPIIDVAAYAAAGNIIYVDRIPNDIQTKEKWGNDFDSYQKTFQTDWELSNVKPLGGGNKLFTGKFKVDITSDKKITTNHAFYDLTAKKGTRMVRFSQSDPSYFKNYLSSTFKYDLTTKSGIEIVRKYGTHVLTDIKLGGASTMMFYAKMKDSYSQNTFKTEVEATYYKVKLNGGTNNATTTVSTHKDMQILVYTVGGSKAVSSSKLTFNPFEGKMENLSFSYNDWLDSVKEPDEQIIGLSNPNTIIYPISEFIFDNPQKKKEVEDALVAYANEKMININYATTLDYLSKYIKDSDNNYLAYLKNSDVFGGNITGTYWVPVPHRWTFYPEGNYYRIQSEKGLFLTRVDDPVNDVKSLEYTNNPSQLWEIEKTPGNNTCPYRIKDPQSDMILTRAIYKVKPLNKNFTVFKMLLWNPNDSNQYWKIE